MLSNSPTLRTVIYLLGVFINAVTATAAASEVKIPVVAIIVLSGVNAVIAAIAKSNVTPEE